jgi:hypothetical protein
MQESEKHLCDYGCGREVKFYFPFVNKWCCSKWSSSCPHVKEKISKTVSSVWKEEESPYRKEEVLERKGNSLKESWKNPESKWFTKECKKKQRNKNLENRQSSDNPYDDEFNLKLSKIHKEIWANPDSSYNSKSRSKKIGLRMKELYKDEEYLKKLQKGLHSRPNKSEIFVTKMLEELNLEYDYVGDSKVWIDGKNPDWIHKKENRIIEFFGWYHTFEYRSKYENDFKLDEEHEKERIEHFKKNGYGCLVVWESDLENLDLIKNKLLNFDMGG